MSSNADLMAAAERILELARQLGAEECAASVSFGVSTELEQRDGRVEKAQESRSLSADVELLVDGRFTSCGTSVNFSTPPDVAARSHESRRDQTSFVIMRTRTWSSSEPFTGTTSTRDT